MGVAIHILHVLLAGIWLGGLVFTTSVVSPALKAMKWSDSERIAVRSVIGRQYAKVGNINLALLLIFSVLDGLTSGFGVLFYTEYVFLAVLFGMVAVHGAYLGKQLAGLAAAERETTDTATAENFAQKRHALQRVSFRLSMLNILVSLAVATLAVLAAGF